MKVAILAVLFGLSGTVTLHAQDTKQPLRVELTKQERSLGYSLLDCCVGGAYVVSAVDRSWKQIKVKDVQSLISEQCSSPEGRYSVFYKNGVWLRDNESQEIQQIEAQGEFSRQCFSPEDKFVYSTGKTVKIYDPARKKSADVAEGSHPTWSPDGKLVGFDYGRHYVLLDLQTGNRKKLFSTNYGADVNWSPDSRYLTYTNPGGSTGGFLFWGIKCIEPYRVWVWRVEDGAHDWVKQICKPGRTLFWVKDSELTFDQH
jgi:tricorn protease-like protein